MKILAAVKIPADINVPASVVDITSDLSSMYPIIGCDLVQPLRVPDVKDALLWCDEEALCKVEPTFNVRASILARTPIFGDVILAGDNGEKIVNLQMAIPKVFFDLLQQEAEKFVAENGNLTADQVLDAMG